MVDSSTLMSTSGASSIQIGRFEAVRAIRSTPWGESFVVTDGTLTGRLNLFAPWLSEDPSFRALFERIAPVMVKFEHPNFGQNYEYGISDGRLYEVEQEFTAPSVHEVSRLLDARGSVTPITVRRAAIELNSALHALHSITFPNGDPTHLLYRAPFPGRMFFTPAGEIKLSAPVAWSGTWLNLNRYKVQDRHTQFLRSPQDIRGERVGVSDDIYALSLCLLLLMRPAPVHATAQRTQQYLNASLEDLRAQDPAFASVIDKTLSVDPNARFTSAQDVVDALAPLSSEELELSNAEVQQFIVETRSASRQNAEDLARSLRNISQVQATLRSKHSSPQEYATLRRRAPTVNIPMEEAPSRSDARRRLSTPPQPTPAPASASNVDAFDAPPPIPRRYTRATPQSLEQVVAATPPSDPKD